MLRSFIKVIDKTLLGGAMQYLFYSNHKKASLKALTERFECRYTVHYNMDRANLLSEYCDEYGSDKGSIKDSGHIYPNAPHTYTDLYIQLFEPRRFEIKKVFECGLGTNQTHLISNMGKNGRPGASHRVWRDYFPNATVYGADIDKTILFEESRIKTSYMDQTDPEAISDYWKTINVQDFDVMIDDGLHTFEAGVCLFENSISMLRKDGIYIIEDVRSCDWEAFRKYFSNTAYKVSFVTFFSSAKRASSYFDNSVIVIRKG